LIDKKHIPANYLFNSKDIRMKLLAGIIDSDGHYQAKCNQYEVTFENETLIDNLITLVKSLGFACYKHQKIGTWTHNGVKKSKTYFRINICGDGIEDIPVVLPYKKASQRNKNKDVRVVGFNIQKTDDDNFYGFEIDGNHRYFMDNFLVTHNSNGKSKFIELFESSFGEYCCKFPITLLTGKRAASNAATSELARAKGKRFGALQEPSEDEKLNIGLMKELSGGDKIQARLIYKEPIEFKPQFKMILACNHLPAVPSDDGGTWRRIRALEFTSRFCDNPDPAKPNEFPIDKELSSKFPDWKEHFMALLIEFYKVYIEKGIIEPPEVLECTKEYQRANDGFLDYVEQELEVQEYSFISHNDVYTCFKMWVGDNAPPHFKNIRRKEFIKALEKIIGKSVSIQKTGGWKGWGFKSNGSGAEQPDELDG
jgi:P4 family phage/plasmid primase-like protien